MMRRENSRSEWWCWLAFGLRNADFRSWPSTKKDDGAECTIILEHRVFNGSKVKNGYDKCGGDAEP